MEEDRISEILIGHIDALTRQLELMAKGVDFTSFGDKQPPIPRTIQDVQRQIDSLTAALDRHKARKDA